MENGRRLGVRLNNLICLKLLFVSYYTTEMTSVTSLIDEYLDTSGVLKSEEVKEYISTFNLTKEYMDLRRECMKLTEGQVIPKIQEPLYKMQVYFKNMRKRLLALEEGGRIKLDRKPEHDKIIDQFKAMMGTPDDEKDTICVGLSFYKNTNRTLPCLFGDIKDIVDENKEKIEAIESLRNKLIGRKDKTTEYKEINDKCKLIGKSQIVPFLDKDYLDFAGKESNRCHIRCLFCMEVDKIVTGKLNGFMSKLEDMAVDVPKID